jgi:uncharacterized membrane protein
MLVLTGTVHFVPDSFTLTPGPNDLTAMVPPWNLAAGPMVYVFGGLELLGALGLVLPARRAADVFLALLVVAPIPANLYAAMNYSPVNGDPATPLWFRFPEHVLSIAVALCGAGAAAAVRRPLATPGSPLGRRTVRS